jgi:hypothetical protein
MAHFAKLDSDNKVVHVSVVDNDVILTEDGTESEELGIEHLLLIHGPSTWKQTSYNSNFRKNYAGIGFTYDETLDAFIPPKPYPSWSLNEETCKWEPPIPKPETTRENYLGPFWDEDTLSWIDIDL